MASKKASENGKWQAQYELAVSDLMDLLAAQEELRIEIELQLALVQLLWELMEPP